jgi:hypothetical protein
MLDVPSITDRINNDLSRTQPFRCGLSWVTRSFLAENPPFTPTPESGEILNPAQRIRVEGFEQHVTTVGARQNNCRRGVENSGWKIHVVCGQ